MNDDYPDVSREMQARLRSLESLVKKWNPTINLVSRATVDQTWKRHIVDSAQLYRLGHRSGHWVDLGSGGGFPGLVVACMSTDDQDGPKVTLIESDKRKATFLRVAAQELQIQINVIAQRIETVPPQRADTLSARALASLPHLLRFADRHLSPDGVALFPKGASWQQEVEQARKDWHFDLHVHPSVTDPDGAILAVKALSHV